MTNRLFDLLPEKIAAKQASWERRCAMRRARECGSTLKDIAAGANLSMSRVQQLVSRAQRELELGRPSPLEKFLSEPEVIKITYTLRKSLRNLFAAYDPNKTTHEGNPP